MNEWPILATEPAVVFSCSNAGLIARSVCNLINNGDALIASSVVGPDWGRIAQPPIVPFSASSDAKIVALRGGL